MKNCKDCGHCKIIENNRLNGICTEEHGPRNAKGELGKMVPMNRGACRHYVPRMKPRSKKVPSEEEDADN